MKRAISEMCVALVVALACALSPAVLVAQTPPAQQTTPSADGTTYDDYFMSTEHRQKIYDETRKKPGKAVLYTLLLPGLGNIYAEQYLLAGLAIVLMAFAGTFIGYGVSTGQSRIIVIGGFTAAAAYGGGAATSLYGVSQHNQRLRQGLKIEEARVREVWAPALVLRF